MCEWVNMWPENSILLELPKPGIFLPGHADNIHAKQSFKDEDPPLPASQGKNTAHDTKV